MGPKKGKRTLGKADKVVAQTAQGLPQPEEPPSRFSGVFETDYLELCAKKNMEYIPPIVPRLALPGAESLVERSSVISIAKSEEKKPKKGGARNRKTEKAEIRVETIHSAPDISAEVDVSRLSVKSPEPTTFRVVDNLVFYKPTIQVEKENPELPDSVSAIYIRGWSLERPLLEVFEQCWPALVRLTHLTLWRVGLTSANLAFLATFLPTCTNLKNLTLDANPLPDQSFHVLLDERSILEHLTLRHCSIDNIGAKALARALRVIENKQPRLLSLNLNGNQIGDEGMEGIVHALRRNRTLLSLSLSNNQIGDKGAVKLAEILGPFPLIQEELAERRHQQYAYEEYEKKKAQKKKEKEAREKKEKEQRAAAKESVRGKDREETKKEQKEETKRKKDQKEDGKGRKEETKRGKGKEKGGKGEGKRMRRDSVRSLDYRDEVDSEDTSKTSRESFRSKAGKDSKGDVEGIKAKDGRGKPSKTAPKLPLGKTPSKMQLVEEAPEEQLDKPSLQLLDEPFLLEGRLLFPGNRVLVNLSLANNRIGEKGLKALQTAVQGQAGMATSSWESGKGLMRLYVDRNPCSPQHGALRQIREMMATRDPFYTPSCRPSWAIAADSADNKVDLSVK